MLNRLASMKTLISIDRPLWASDDPAGASLFVLNRRFPTRHRVVGSRLLHKSIFRRSMPSDLIRGWKPGSPQKMRPLKDH